MKHRNISFWIMGGIWVLMLLVNLAARLSHPLTDWYIACIFPYISGFWSRISGLFPFSVGEWLIVGAVVLIGLLLPGIPLVLLFGKDQKLRILSIAAHVYGWIGTWTVVVVTMHYLVLFQGTQLSQTLGDVKYSNKQVLAAVRQLIEEANAEGELVRRDENGYMLLTDDLMPEAKACMARLSEEYPRFGGYYPNAKPIYHAYFFSQQNLLGIYYAHTLEANYNPVIYEVNLPVTICHEYTHLKGNIFEDEAGYYAFLACMTSESHDFRYSALISALEWLELDFGDDAAAWEEYYALWATRSEGVRRDMYLFVPEEYWDAHKETNEIIPTQLVTDTAEKVMDASLKVNGITDGTHSYHGMTALLLRHLLSD